MKEIFNFAKRIGISEEYKDCRKYIQRYNSEYHSHGKPMIFPTQCIFEGYADMLINYPIWI